MSLLATAGAQACMADRQRGQTVVLTSFDAARTSLPVEYNITAGDLLAVFAPKLAKVKIIDAKGKASDVVQALDAERYRALSAQGDGRVPAEVSVIQQKSREWLYFGAARPGLAYVDLQDREGRALLRVNIEQIKDAPRGQTITLTEAQQDKPQPLTMFDVLELELPGLPGDGWTAGISAGTVGISSITAVVPAKADASPRVRMRLGVQLQQSEQALEVKRGGAVWRYTLQARAIPTC